MTTRKKYMEMAERMGRGLDVDTAAPHVTIRLPTGMQVQGNPGLDVLCNDGERMSEVWSVVHADLKGLAMEPNERPD
jgi:hypothetical protein